MFRHIVKYGVIAGLVVGSFMFATLVAADKPLSMSASSVVVGFAAMLVALSAVFVGIKHHRDHDLGGVIRFWPAFGMGLAISFIAGLFYILAWEATLAVTQMDFAGDYANYLLAQEKAKGVSAEALAKVAADLDKFKADYRNPLYRMPITFTEFFPVGILVSLVSAALLRNSRFMPLQRG